MHAIDTVHPEPDMTRFQPQRRQTRLHRATVLALVFVVNAGIAGFIDRLASSGAAPAAMAASQPVPLAHG